MAKKKHRPPAKKAKKATKVKAKGRSGPRTGKQKAIMFVGFVLVVIAVSFLAGWGLTRYILS